ncbi:MAG: hypothetical protein AVDCRST_MAG87-3457, partial [uncultured Thermomicrobiales bacterium]
RRSPLRALPRRQPHLHPHEVSAM